MSEAKAVKYLALTCLVLLTLTFVGYITKHAFFIAYVNRFGFDPMTTQHSYFRNLTSDPLASYYGFIGAALLILCAFKLRKHVIGSLPLILAVWLIISSLDEYYVTLNYEIVVIIGAIFEVITLCIGAYIVIRKGKNLANSEKI